jgi:hypothetical protein
VVTTERPGLPASASASNSSRAQAGSSRRLAIWKLTSLQACCSSLRLAVNTGLALRQTRTSSAVLVPPMAWVQAPRPASRSTCITALRSSRRIWITAPSSSVNSAAIMRSRRRPAICGKRSLPSTSFISGS